MAEDSKISWTNNTFNPWMGCTKVSPACKFCYAERDMDLRYGKVKWGAEGTRVLTSDAYWQKPVKWNRDAVKEFNEWTQSDCFEQSPHRPRVFCASLADVFEDWRGPILDRNGMKLFWSHSRQPHESKYHWVTEDETAGGETLVCMNDVRSRLFDLIDATPNIDWLLLTKRPENVPLMWQIHPAGRYQEGMSFTDAYRRDNVWIGVSVENQKCADERIPYLLKYRELAPVLFLSCEPLLEQLDLSQYLKSLDWIIAGGESGTIARTMNANWVRKLRDDCAASEVPFHFKQWGEYLNFDGHYPSVRWEADHIDGSENIESVKVDGQTYSGCDVELDPDDNSVYVRVGKKKAGRSLDGFTHDGFPCVLRKPAQPAADNQ